MNIDPAPAGAQVFLDDPREPAGSDVTALTIGACSECGLVQSTAAPVSYYRSVVTAAGLSEAMRSHRAAQVERFVRAHALGGTRVVEVGCHRGYFLDILADAGLTPHGTEFGGVADPVTRHPIIDAYPEPGQAIDHAPFAAFFCLNFLEHAPDPRGFLRGIRENLAPGGVGLIEVPNHAQQQRLGRVFDYVADHLSYFDAGTLALSAMLSGFTVERIEETRAGENLELWVRARGDGRLADEANEVEEIGRSVQEWLTTERRNGHKVALWGASHQALTLLAQVSPTDVGGIFDSAPFKQGKYAPVSRLPILAPSASAVGAFDTILIVAAGYEKEIDSVLRVDLGFHGTIYHLDGGRPVPL